MSVKRTNRTASIRRTVIGAAGVAVAIGCVFGASAVGASAVAAPATSGVVGAGSSSGLAASPVALPTEGLKYVAIGDSYSSGIGLGDLNPAVPADCEQSLDNFPHQLAATLGLSLTDVTCSGAQAENVTTVPQPVNGSTVPVQTAALSAETDIVTITVGGNGLKFTTVAAACAAATAKGPLLAPGLSALSSCQQIPAIAALPGHMPLLGQAVGATYSAVRAAAPNAKIFVLGYPSIAPDAANVPSDGSCFTSLTTPGGFPFTDADTPFLHSIEEALDDTVESQAETAGFTYVPTFENSLAHSSCAAAAESYVNGVFVDFTVPAAPVIEEKSLHPNKQGVAFMADLAVDAVAAAFPAPTPTFTPIPTANPTATPTATPNPTATPTVVPTSQPAGVPTSSSAAAATSTAAAGALASTGTSTPLLAVTGMLALLLLLAGGSALAVHRRRAAQRP